MKRETGGLAIEEFVGLNPNMHSFLVYDGREHKEANGVNKNVVETISYSECEDVLLKININE